MKHSIYSYKYIQLFPLPESTEPSSGMFWISPRIQTPQALCETFDSFQPLPGKMCLPTLKWNFLFQYVPTAYCPGLLGTTDNRLHLLLSLPSGIYTK